jgi:hypothetical protein
LTASESESPSASGWGSSFASGLDVVVIVATTESLTKVQSAVENVTFPEIAKADESNRQLVRSKVSTPDPVDHRKQVKPLLPAMTLSRTSMLRLLPERAKPEIPRGASVPPSVL